MPDLLIFASEQRDRSVGKKRQKIILCAASWVSDWKFEVRVMGVSLFRFFPGIARFQNQSQFDS